MTEKPKRFDELSEMITEEQYRNNGRIHYSDISNYLRNGFASLVTPRKEESESLSFGSVVDCMVTQGMDEFYKRYFVDRGFKLSDNQKLVVAKLTESGCDDMSYIQPSEILRVLDEIGLYKNLKDETKVGKVVSECGECYNHIMANKGKTMIDKSMYDDAIGVRDALMTSQMTKSLLFDEKEGVERFFQLKFNGTFDGYPVCAMFDTLYIDHNIKTIYPIDLKTTCSGYEFDFPKAFLKWRYDIQARLYSHILKQVIDNDDFYKDYLLGSFMFIYVSRSNKSPLVWNFDDTLSREDIVVKNRHGEEIATLYDIGEPIKEIYDVVENSRTVPKDVFPDRTNDIMWHLRRSIQ